jgi:hypothetical protein
MDGNQRCCEHDHQQAEQAVRPLDPLERQHPHRRHGRDRAGHRHQEIGSAGEVMEDQPHAAKLGGAGDQGAHQRSQQGEEPELEPEAVAHEVEHRLLGDRGDPPAHLAEHHDSDGREGEHPDQRVVEDRAGLRREHQLADVDETADRSHDPKRQLKRIQDCPRSA